MAWEGVGRHRPIISSNGNRTSKLQVRVYRGLSLVGLGRHFRRGSSTGTGKHHRLRVRVG